MQPKTKVAIVLAGGLGTRLQSVVSKVPKPMAPLGGKPFLDLILRYWIKQGINKFIISVGYKFESIINYFGDNFEDATIEYVIEEKPLGTGGGILKVLNEVEIKDKFLIINGDTFFAVNLGELESFHNKNNSKWTLSLFKSSDNERYMQFKLSSGFEIIDIIRGAGSKHFYSNGGIYLVDNKETIINNAPNSKEFSLETDIISKVVGQNIMHGFYVNETFIDIGVPEDYKLSEKLLSMYF